MIDAIELLRNLAGLMFWAFIDLSLAVIWGTIIAYIVIAMIPNRKDE